MMGPLLIQHHINSTVFFTIKYVKETKTYNKTISILDKYVSDSSKTFEELFQVSLSYSKGETTNIHSWSNHFLWKQTNTKYKFN